MTDVEKDVKDSCPQVLVVDSQAFPHQVPIKLDVPRLGFIYLLLAAALLGVFIEAGFICHLYSRHTISPDIQKTEYRKAEKNQFPGSAHDSNEILPEKKAESKPAAKPKDKPAAFLQIGAPSTSGDNSVLQWRSNAFPGFMKGLDYKNNSLYVQQEGYYYIFSKVSHLENCIFFQHKLMQCSDNYNRKPMELMQNSRYLCSSGKSQSMGERGNSYLGGIFHLLKGDSVFVKVNNSSLVHYNTYENFFGAFMV